MDETTRAFLCIELPDELKKSLRECLNNLNSRYIRTVGDEQLHITIFFFARATKEQLTKVMSTLDSVGQNGFDVHIKDFGVFDVRRPNVVFANIVDNDNISKLYESLKPGLQTSGIEMDDREFTPHLTVARVKAHNKEVLEQIGSFVTTARFSGTFQCRSITLKQSTLTSTGPVYQDLYTKPLHYS